MLALPRASGDEEPEREDSPAVRKFLRRPHKYGKRLPRPGSDALEVPFLGQIAGDGQDVAFPLERRTLPHSPPLFHRGGETEDLSPKVGVDFRGGERAFGGYQVLRKIRPQGADEADPADQIRKKDGEQEQIPGACTLSVRFPHEE